MESLPAPRTVVQLPDGTWAYTDQTTPAPWTAPAAVSGLVQPQVVHVHQAAPDRTVQRVALGSGIGAGTVAAGVYFGPLLVAAMTSMAISLAVVAVIIVALVWGATTIVRTLAAPEGEKAAQTLAKARRRG